MCIYWSWSHPILFARTITGRQKSLLARKDKFAFFIFQRTIDILKIDIEGDEWKAITQMHRSGVLNQVKQLSIETHFSMIRYGQPTYWGHVHPSKQLSQLRQLYEAGFRIIMRERNLRSLQRWLPFKYPLTNVNEITLLHQ